MKRALEINCYTYICFHIINNNSALSTVSSSENAKAWAAELLKTLNRDEKYALITYHQLVGVCLYIFVRPEHADKVRQNMLQMDF